MKNPILVVYRDARDEICNFMHETCSRLALKQLVVAVLVNETTSIADLCRGRSVLFRSSASYWYFRPVNLWPFSLLPGMKRRGLLLQVYCISLMLWLYHRLSGSSRPLFWAFHPFDYDMLKYVSHLGRVLYDNVDYFSAPEFRHAGEMAEKELQLLGLCSVVTAISPKNRQRLGNYFTPVHLVPQGFRIQSFTSDTPAPPEPLRAWLRKNGRKPMVLFVGGINHRLDYRLLARIIPRLPRFSFCIVGPLQFRQDSFTLLPDNKPTAAWVEQLQQLPNVWFSREAVSPLVIPSLIAGSSVCIIPYDLRQEFNLYCYPMKLFEYFYGGKPVVSTAIPAVIPFSPAVTVCRTTADWVTAIRYAAAHPLSPSVQKKQRQWAIDNSWEHKVAAILEIVYGP